MIDVSYAIALASRLLGFITGHKRHLTGPYALPLPISISLNILGLLFLLFAAITFNFPTSYPVTHKSMNYTSAAIGVIGVIATVTWITTGKRKFSGPGGMEVERSRHGVKVEESYAKS